MLQLDRPVPAHTPESLAAEVQRNYSWNFSVNLLDGASFALGTSFLSAATIVPLFVSTLTPSPYALGLAAMIAQGGWFLPQLLTAAWIERLPRKKPVVVNVGFILERLPMLVMIAAAPLALRWPLLALALFLLGYAWHQLGAGLVAPAWQDLIARCFPVDRRGRFLGTTWFIGTGAGALAGLFCGWLLQHAPFPANFTWVFAFAALFIMLSWVFIALTREPVQPPDPPAHAQAPHLEQLPRILRLDVNYRQFLIARLTLAFGGLGLGFLAVAAVQRWDLPTAVGGRYTAALLVGQMLGNLIFGRLADRCGHKLSLEASGFMGAAAFALAWLAPRPAWFYLVFLLAGLNIGAINVSGTLVVMEFCAAGRIPTYTGLANTLIGLVNLLAPLTGAFLAKRGYGLLFAVAAAVNLAAVVLMRWYVREPRFAPQTPAAAAILPARE